MRPAPVSAPLTRFVVRPDEPLSVMGMKAIVLSPDGRRLAYVAGRDQRRLYVHDLDRFDARLIPETEGAQSPVFSPDGRWLAFAAGSSLKKVLVAGGAPQVVCPTEDTGRVSLDWGADNEIYFSSGVVSGIQRVPASGGTPTIVTTLSAQELSHQFPHVLPDGQTLLYNALVGPTSNKVYAQSLATGERRELADGAGPVYLRDGRVAFVQGNVLYAMPFDAKRLQATGPSVPVLQGIRQEVLGGPEMSITPGGTLAYVPTSDSERLTELVWVDRHGVERPAGSPPRPYQAPRLSPDGQRVLLQISAGTAADIWLYDLTRTTLARLTFDGSSAFPLWSPDGGRIVLSSLRDGAFSLQKRSSDGREVEQWIAPSPKRYVPLSWSPDGATLAGVSVDPTTFNDVWTLGVGDHEVKPFVRTPYREGGPTFSPDGRFIAYASDQSGRSEIYVRPFRGPGGETLVSTMGGSEPVWAKHANLMFYRQGTAMMAVDVATSPALLIGPPHVVFDRAYDSSGAYWPDYDVTQDGQQFLLLKKASRDSGPAQVDVVLNWRPGS